MRACSAHGIIELIESITYRAEWCGIRAIERGEVESPKWNRGYYIASAGQVSDLETEKKAVAIFSKTGIPQNTYRPCFVALKCVTIRGKLRVYAHITVEGDPVPKYTKSGCLKHPCGKGLVGVDLGPQSVAAVSETSVILENLAERNGKSTKRHERKERLFLRALDRSRRANNKDRYNEDGTVKKGVHKPWKKSKQYRIKEACLKELRRKNALSRKYANNELANRILKS